MSDFLYFCKNCRVLETSESDNEKMICEECGSRYYPLHVTEDDWDNMDKDTKREVLRKAISSTSNKRSTDNKAVKRQAQGRNSLEKADSDKFATIRNALDKLADSQEGKFSKLSIIGFICSFFCCFSFVGLAAGVYDLVRGKGKKSLSIAAICVSVLMMFGSIGLLGGTSDSNKDAIVADSVTEDVTEMQQIEDIESMVTSTPTPTEIPTLGAIEQAEELTGEEQAIVDDNSVIDAMLEENHEVESQTSEITMYATDKVKVRQQPNTNCEVLAMVSVGEQVTVLEEGSDGWSSVNYGGINGYIKSDFLSPQKPSDDVTTQGSTQVADNKTVQTTVDNTADNATAQTAAGLEAMTATVATNTAVVAEPTQEMQASVSPIDNSQSKGIYTLNINNGTLHNTGCNHGPEPQNCAYYNTLEEAKAAGAKKSCSYCHPY